MGETSHGGALAIGQEDANGEFKTDWIKLEDGVEIWFAATGTYRAGDYWLIPARTATGDVEWPHELAADGKPKVDADGNAVAAACPPHGPYHYYAPLLLSIPGDPGFTRDCRCAVRHLPCAGYSYAFGGMAIGGTISKAQH